MEYILSIGFIFYFIYTLNFALKFNKEASIYTTNQKVLHNILIWLIPIIWIRFLKYMDKETPGSHYFRKKRNSGMTYESGISLFDDWGSDTNGFGDLGGGDGGGDGGGGD